MEWGVAAIGIPEESEEEMQYGHLGWDIFIVLRSWLVFDRVRGGG